MESVKDLEDFAVIKGILRDEPGGMTVTELARALGRTKNTVGRYLDILHASGQVEMRMFGRAKVFTLTRRVPLSQLFSHTPEMMMILDRDHRVLQVNDPFLRLLSLPREGVVGKNLAFLPVHEAGIQELVQSLVGSLREERADTDLLLSDGEERTFHAKIIPILLEDGTRGSTVMLEDQTRVHQAEKALRESEKKYRELVENANSIILKMDLAGTVTFFNEYAERFFGFSRDEILGKKVIGTIVPPTESSGRDLELMIARLLSHTEEFQSNENENITRDGRRVWIHWSNRTISDDRGNPVGVLSVGDDISDHRRLDEQLRASERRFRDLADLLPQPVFEADAAGTLLFANRQAYLTFGYEPGELQGKVQVIDMIAPEDRERAQASIGRMLREGMLGKEEYSALRKGGGRFPIVNYSAPIRESDRIIGFRGIAIDLTPQKAAESELRKERDFTDAVLHTLDSLVVVLDREARIVRFNHACEALTGYAEEEVRGRPFRDIFLLPEEAVAVMQVFDGLVEGRGPLRLSNSWVTKGGEPRFISWSCTGLRDETGAVTHVIGTGIDMTDHRRLEEELGRYKNGSGSQPDPSPPQSCSLNPS
ncbi:MAG: PAS domain S-box protein [Methanomicrobiales archaeon]|nr:PAS domain S-box protein [Methanomicrobiales archaeon]